MVLGLAWLQKHYPHLNRAESCLESWSPVCHSCCLQSALSIWQPSNSSPKGEYSVDLSLAPEIYHDLCQVSSKSKACSLPPHHPYDCDIDFLACAPIPTSRVYNILRSKRQALEKYIGESLNARLIRPSSSSFGAGFFFCGEERWILHPCID